MFGHQDDKKDDDKSSEQNTTVVPDKPAEATVAVSDKPEETTPAVDAAADSSTTAPEPKTDETAPEAEDTKPAADTPSDDDDAWQHPGAPIEDDDEEEEETSKGPEPIEDIVGTNAGPDFKPFPQSGSALEDPSTDNTPHELIDIKQNALNDLMPLADKLDQTPEDKFRTTMMIIQASDDQKLLQTAYDAAHEIKDEKVRAQALLDIVNEINYFTQHPEN